MLQTLAFSSNNETDCNRRSTRYGWVCFKYENSDEKKKLILVVTLDSDLDEQENVPDLLKECTNHSIQFNEKNGKIDRLERWISLIYHLDLDENKPEM